MLSDSYSLKAWVYHYIQYFCGMLCEISWISCCGVINKGSTEPITYIGFILSEWLLILLSKP